MDPVDVERLVRLETALARRDPDFADEPLADLLDPGFLEHGASGRRWSRDEVAATIDEERTAVRLEDVSLSPIAEDAVLLTYRSVDPDRGIGDAWRASIWVRRDGRWRIRFHQGTRLPEGSRIG